MRCYHGFSMHLFAAFFSPRLLLILWSRMKQNSIVPTIWLYMNWTVPSPLVGITLTNLRMEQNILLLMQYQQQHPNDHLFKVTDLYSIAKKLLIHSMSLARKSTVKHTDSHLIIKAQVRKKKKGEELLRYIQFINSYRYTEHISNRLLQQKTLSWLLLWYC